MSTFQVPAEHIARLEAASDDQLRALVADNQRAAGRAAGNGWPAERAKCLAYAQAGRDVLAKRTESAPAQARPTVKAQPATDKQVSYALSLISARIKQGLPARLSLDGGQLRAMTKTQVSAIISELKEQY